MQDIQIVVRTGLYNNASCSEMEFYSKPTQANTNLMGTVFANPMLTALNPGVTLADIGNLQSNFLKGLASCMYNGTYNYKYRVQTYEPYPNLTTIVNNFKIGNYSQYENPTGIYFPQGQKAILFGGDEASGQSIFLRVSNLTVHGAQFLSAYTDSWHMLRPGYNEITVPNDGLGYISYYTDNQNAKPVQIHITTGLVNGYFDSAKDGIAEWGALAFNNVYPYLDVKGKYVQLHYRKKLLKIFNPLDLRPLINSYDSLQRLQHHMMGWVKHHIVPKNRTFAVIHPEGGLYAGATGVHFNYGSYANQKGYYTPQGVFSAVLWPVTHEFGHLNQLRPDLMWGGMGEVTNNIYSIYADYTLPSNRYRNSRLETENVNPHAGDSELGGRFPAMIGGSYKGFFDKAFVYKTNYPNIGIFAKLISFWQLMLYYSFAGGLRDAPTLQQRIMGEPITPSGGADYPHWLGDLMQKNRLKPRTNLMASEYVLNFTKDVCDVLQEDLSDYFVKTGFLKAVDTTYAYFNTTRPYIITENDVAETIASIKQKGYRLPVSPVIYYISANSLAAFKGRLVAQGTYNVGVVQDIELLTVSHSEWKNVVVFETYSLTNQLMEVTMVGMRRTDNTATIITYPQTANEVYAISYDGSRKLVYSRSALPVHLLAFKGALTNAGAELTWNTTNEQNNAGFRILKSIDGKAFAQIAEISQSSNTGEEKKYSYLDAKFSTSSYYKLQQVDKDGSVKTYDERVVYIKDLVTEDIFKAFPNPTQNMIYIRGLSGGGDVQIHDITGKRIKSVKTADLSKFKMSTLDVPKGVYTLRVVTDHRVFAKKLIKY